MLVSWMQECTSFFHVIFCDNVFFQKKNVTSKSTAKKLGKLDRHMSKNVLPGFPSKSFYSGWPYI